MDLLNNLVIHGLQVFRPALLPQLSVQRIYTTSTASKPRDVIKPTFQEQYRTDDFSIERSSRRMNLS